MGLEDEESGGWREYKRLVLNGLDRLEASIKTLREVIEDIRRRDLDPMRQDITALKVKAAMWGALGGLIAGAVIGALVSKGIH